MSNLGGNSGLDDLARMVIHYPEFPSDEHQWIISKPKIENKQNYNLRLLIETTYFSSSLFAISFRI